MQTGGMAASTVVPLMRYRDCAAAVDWLERAFGFERGLVVPAEDGGVAYAQLVSGSGLVMIGPVGESPLDSHLAQPSQVGGSSTQCCYLAVLDIKSHFERARAAGAGIVLEPEDGAFGAQGYSCRDPEGHLWTFGSYDPWRGRRKPDIGAARDAPHASPARRASGVWQRMALFGLFVAAGAVTIAILPGGRLGSIRFPAFEAAAPAPERDDTNGMPATGMEELEAAAAAKDAALAAAETAAGVAQKALAESEAERAGLQTRYDEARREIEREQAARAKAETDANAAIAKVAADVQALVDIEKRAKEAAEQQARASEAALADERAARLGFEREAEELKSKLAIEVEAREAAELAARAAADRPQSGLTEPAGDPPDRGAPSLTTGSTPKPVAPTPSSPDRQSAETPGPGALPGASAGPDPDASAAPPAPASGTEPAANTGAAPAPASPQQNARVRTWQYRQPAARPIYRTAPKPLAAKPKPKPKKEASVAKPAAKPKPKPAPKKPDAPILNVL